MHHYVSLFVQSDDGSWRGCLPDFPIGETTGKRLDLAILSATASLTSHASRRRTPLPQPKTLAEIAADREWLLANGVTLSCAVIVMIPLHDRTTLDGQKSAQRPGPRLVHVSPPIIDPAPAGTGNKRGGSRA
jgi:hypothetical protein